MQLSEGAHLGRYKIVSAVGAGGMGEVYRAEDTLLNRPVAIKVMPEHLAENAEALKRFQKEAKALAALSHPNILAIHDFVSEQGVSFAVMELLEGETLRARIAKSPLGWQKAAEIASAVAEGLAAAHSKGVIHRDLKPENIYLPSRGNLKILDFGLARLKPTVKEGELTEAPTMSRMTESGVVMGTVPYMSPEQVRGESVDARSDIFSLGTVLYEMLSGHRPFTGRTTAETTAAILRDEPPALIGIPPELDRIVQHCLEKDPERRLHSAHDLAFALKDLLTTPSSKTDAAQPAAIKRRKFRITAALTILVFAVSGIGLVRFLRRPSERKIESLAVLPIKNLSGDPRQEYFADGMTEELIEKLASISALRVISRTSVMEYKESKRKSLPQIAKELNVDAIVEGSVMQAGNRVRITAQLIYAPTDRHLWADSYERDMTDILALQSDVASAVAHEIRVKLTPQEKDQFAQSPSVNPASYEAYLRGIGYTEMVHPSDEELRIGITMFQKAIEIDPGFARAYASMSKAYSRMDFLFGSGQQSLRKAKEAVDRAFQLNPKLPEVHIALGFYYYWGLGDYERALQEFSIAQKGAPNDVQLLMGIAAIHKRQGNFEVSLEENQRILELDPKNAMAADELGILYELMDNYAQAQQFFDLGISLAPDQSYIYMNKVNDYLRWKGDTKRARAMAMEIPNEALRKGSLVSIELLDRNYQAALDSLPLKEPYASYESDISMGDCYRLLNKQEKARESYETARIQLEKLLENNPANAYLRSVICIAYAGLNRKQEAIHEAKAAVELFPVSKDAVFGPGYLRSLAIVYVMVGEYEAALDQIEYLLSIPGSSRFGVTVPLLRIEPTWDALRSNPRFQKILEKYQHAQTR
jgi:serine/threonine protein kinase/Flp pilus assembly protein TadD